MDVRKLYINRGLPAGFQQLAIIRNGYEGRIHEGTPRGIFLTASLISHTHTLVPSAEAIRQKLAIIHHVLWNVPPNRASSSSASARKEQLHEDL